MVFGEVFLRVLTEVSVSEDDDDVTLLMVVVMAVS